MKNQDPITWLQFNNLLPIILNVIGIVAFLMVIKSDVRDITTKLDYLTQRVEEYRSTVVNLTSALNRAEQKLNTLEGMHIK